MALNLNRALLSSRLVITFTMLIGTQLAGAQVNDWVAKNCPALQQPAQKALIDLCNGHKACAMMVKAQDTCPKAQKFLTTLDTAMGAAPSGLMGFLSRRSITPEAVWQASLPDALRELEQRPEWKAKVDLIAKLLPPGSSEQYAGRNAAGRQIIRYGHEKDEDGSTVSGPVSNIVFISGVQMQRATYKSGKQTHVDHVDTSGRRIVAVARADNLTLDGLEFSGGKEYVGTFFPDVDVWANGVLTLPDKTRFEGLFSNKALYQGKSFRADGTLVAEGIFDKDGLSEGKRFDATGVTVAEEVDKPKAQALAAAAAREAADRQRRAQEAARAAEEQRKVAEAARLEREFQSSLTTMNAGQLFNKADELRTAGDTVRARQTQRALIERFPNHPLAATAAQQIAAGSTQQTNSNSTATPIKSASSTSGMSCREAVNRLHKALSEAGDDPKLKLAESRDRNAGQLQILWVTHFYAQSVQRLPQCINDLAYRKRFEDDLAGTRQNCSSYTNGSASCVNGTNYYIDERQVQAVLQQLMGEQGNVATITSSSGANSGCAETPDATLARFNSDLQQFMNQKPQPSASAGSRAQYQWTLFIGTEGLRRLEPLRACLGPHYAANKQALEGMRDNGKNGCERLSTNPASCTATYPTN